MSHSIQISQCFTRGLRTALTGSSLALGLSACSGHVVNLGEGQTPPPEPPPSYSRCRESTTLEGDVTVTEQAQIDELEGCEAIHGALKVYTPFDPDLRPLHALQSVSGTLAFSPPDMDSGKLMGFVMTEGWLDSFEGLEALNAVGSLGIVSAALNLEPLSALRSLTGDGELTITAPNLRDLAPLANLAEIRGLTVMGDQIESIAGPRFSDALGHVYLQGARLTELGEMNRVHSISQDLQILGTGLHDLSGFSSLQYVDREVQIEDNLELRSLTGLENLTVAGEGIAMSGNPLLEDISALTGLQVMPGLAITDNQGLRNIPDFPALGSLKKITIADNDSLEEIADYTGLFNSWNPGPDHAEDRRDVDPGYGAPQALEDRLTILQIFGNPSLRHYAAPMGARGAALLTINANGSLVDLDLGTIEAVDVLSIESNPVLAHVSHALATVEVLSVRGNPALPLQNFDEVRTFQRSVSSEPPPPPRDCSMGCTLPL